MHTRLVLQRVHLGEFMSRDIRTLSVQHFMCTLCSLQTEHSLLQVCEPNT